MFTSKHVLLKKTGADGIGRYDFLKQLKNEFTTTKYIEAKKQTLANLANFAYDPINYKHLKELHVIDLFLAQLSEDNEVLLNFALAGLCNISADAESAEYIVELNGINLISSLLSNSNESIIIDSLTTLYYLVQSSKQHLLPVEVVERIKKFRNSTNNRLKNLASIILNDNAEERD